MTLSGRGYGVTNEQHSNQHSEEFAARLRGAYGPANHTFILKRGLIAALILLGRYFEARSRGQASDAIAKLMELGAKTARVIENGNERDIPSVWP
jgi:cation transport ATPase